MGQIIVSVRIFGGKNSVAVPIGAKLLSVTKGLRVWYSGDADQSIHELVELSAWPSFDEIPGGFLGNFIGTVRNKGAYFHVFEGPRRGLEGES